MGGLSNILMRFAAKVIAVDDTVVPEQQLKVLQDMLKGQKIEIKGKDARVLLHNLKRKHLVNSITVVKNNSNLVFSSEGNGAREAENVSALFRFLDGSFAKPDTVALKQEKYWNMLFNSNGKLFIVKSNSQLSRIELRVIAEDIEKALGRRL